VRKRDKNGRFRAGRSGNPRGRPPADICLTTLLRAALAETDRTAKRTKARLVIDALILAACEGDMKAMGHILDRVDGAVVQVQQTAAVDLEAVAREMKAARDRLKLEPRDSRRPPGRDGR
jgi:hypothetical protein